MAANLIPTNVMAQAAAKGLRLVDAGRAGDGLVPRTITDARLIADLQPLSERKVRAMPGWFARHAGDRKAGWDKAGEETPGYVAWLLWGGDSAAAWAERKVNELDAQREGVQDMEFQIVCADDLRDNPELVGELRNGRDVIERRVAPVTTEIRSESDGSWTLIGHAAVFDSMSQPLGGFREVIQRGAFRKVLKNPDLTVKALFNHDQNLVLGSNTNGTLTLTEDPKGLRYEVNVADTTYGRDLRVLLERGDVTQSSFAFKVAKDGQEWTDQEDGTLLRTITEFKDLLDVSPVTYPAYQDTTSSAVPSSMVTKYSSNSEPEQATGGAVEQPGAQADSQPRRADEQGAHRHRVRRLKLRDKRAA